jgi:hypothetical protein
MNPVRRSRSRAAQARKGRMLSRKRIAVIMQYITAMQVYFR